MRNAALLGGCLLACLLTGPARSQAAPKPATAVKNVLFIISDDLKASVLGCYGELLVQTPHLDGLAAQGVLFDNVYCPSPVCVASRMAMLAGRHPHQIECWTHHDILDSAVPTLAPAMGAGRSWNLRSNKTRSPCSRN